MRNKIIIVALITAMVLATAGFSDTGNVGATMDVGNADPGIREITINSTFNPVEGTTSPIVFNITVSDTNGWEDVSVVNASLTKTGETTRSNASCSFVENTSAVNATYTCTILMYYYDGAGVWTINSYVDDGNTNDTNTSSSFTYNNLPAMQFAPVSISFGTLEPGWTDNASIDDPIVLNNTGNRNFTSVNLTSYDLVGVSNASYFIPAENFSVNVADAANGDILSNATDIAITSAALTRMWNALPGTENLYFYVEEVPYVIPQTYDTSTLGSWVIETIE